MKQHAVITGGGGFIGSNLVRALIAAGYEVTVLDTFVAGRFPERLVLGVPVYEVDVRDTAACAAHIPAGSLVFHLAALPRVQDSLDSPQATHDVNVNGTVSILVAAQQSGARRVVLASSAAVYGDQEVLPLAEDLPALPKSPYGLHKYIGEQYCRLWSTVYGLETVSLRFFNVYGPFLDPAGPYALVVGKFLACRAAGQPLPIVGDGTHTRDYVHVGDVARCLIAAGTSASAGKGEVVNVGSGVETSVNDLARCIGGPVTHLPPRLEPARSCARIERARTLLGWEPAVPLGEGLAAV